MMEPKKRRLEKENVSLEENDAETAHPVCEPKSAQKSEANKWMKMEKEKAEDVRMRYLKEIFEKYQNIIVTFELEDREFKIDCEFNLKPLKNLHEIRDYTGKDFLATGFLELCQIHNAKIVMLEETKLNFGEILKLTGNFCKVRCDEWWIFDCCFERFWDSY
ncbi:unnamed protein product [Caenorhabditis angaria]|uniref:Uncharacterized protein n=1 Tax=Caenorhabditis angaria TaxID=860376 RepID=A0A9P1I9Q8_9PELO|nr:unnamed protein product [Caenorhabditis angaria]